MNKNFKYKIGISFAQEDMNVALCLLLALKQHFSEDEIFFHPISQADLAGKDLHSSLMEIYTTGTQSVIVLLSDNYLRRNKEFLPTEINALTQRQNKSSKTGIIPVQLDNITFKDLDPSIMVELPYHNWEHNPEQIAKIVAKSIGTSLKVATELMSYEIERPVTISKTIHFYGPSTNTINL